MLNSYLQRTQVLLADLKIEIFNIGLLTSFINTARSQLAGEGECIRVIGSISTVNGTNNYAFSAISVSGVQGVLHVRRIAKVVGSGLQLLDVYPWEWFDQFYLNNAAPVNAAPTTWAQYAQGASGSFYLSPTPDAVYVLKPDTVCYPAALSKDSDVEAIPYPWTDAVPYFAAYLAYLYAQKEAQAEALLKLYKLFVDRARKMSTPAVLPFQYEQAGVVLPAIPGNLQAGNARGREQA